MVYFRFQDFVGSITVAPTPSHRIFRFGFGITFIGAPVTRESRVFLDFFCMDGDEVSSATMCPTTGKLHFFSEIFLDSANFLR